MATEKATFAGGCFWGVEVIFRNVDGVQGAAVGYTGGTKENPTYNEICSGATGHAEAIEVEFDPDQVSYNTLLDVFFDSHDSTTRDRQGSDVGSQYRSAIFIHSPEQEKSARAKVEALGAAGRFHAPIVTQITPAATFWPAEEYHQRYLEKAGRASCKV